MAITTLDTGNNLTSLSVAKSYVGSTASTSNDGRLTRLINAASYMFNTWTNRKLKARDITEFQDGNARNWLLTNEWPINSNTTNIDIRIDVDRDYTTEDKVDSTSIIIKSTEGMIVLDDDSFSRGPDSVKLSYNAGYTTIPYDLEQACLEQVRYMFNKERNNWANTISESVEGARTVQGSYEMPLSVRDVLQRYKRVDRWQY